MSYEVIFIPKTGENLEQELVLVERFGKGSKIPEVLSIVSVDAATGRCSRYRPVLFSDKDEAEALGLDYINQLRTSKPNLREFTIEARLVDS